MIIYVWLYIYMIIYDYIYIYMIIYIWLYIWLYYIWLYHIRLHYIYIYYIWLYRMKSSWVQSRFHPLSTRPCPKRLQLDAVGMEPMEPVEPVGDLLGMPQTSARHAAEVVVLLAMEGLVTWYFFEEPSPGYCLVLEKSLKCSQEVWVYLVSYYHILPQLVSSDMYISRAFDVAALYVSPEKDDCLAYFELWAVSNNW